MENNELINKLDELRNRQRIQSRSMSMRQIKRSVRRGRLTYGS